MTALLHRSRHALAVSTLFVFCGGGLAACGEDDKTSSPTPTTATTAGITPGVSTSDDGAVTLEENGPSNVIASWFSFARRGEAQGKCDLESEAYQQEQYGGTGQACLDDVANGQPQAVWAENVKIVSIDEQGDFATAVVQPNASTDAQATVGLSKSDAGWQVSSFR